MMTKFHKLEYLCYKHKQTNLPVSRVTPAVDYSDNNLNLGGFSFGLFTFVLFSWRPGFEASGFSNRWEVGQEEAKGSLRGPG